MTAPSASAAPVAIVAAVTPTLALFSGVSVTPMFILLAISVVAATWAQQPWRGVPGHALAFVAVTMAWAFASCLWTVTPVDQAVVSVLSAAGLAVAGLMAVRASELLAPGQRRVVKRGWLAGIGLAVIVLLCEVISSYPLTGFVHGAGPAAASSIVSRGVAVLVLLLWPAVFVVAPPFAQVLFLAAAFAVVATGKYAVALALVLAAAAFLAVRKAPVLTLRLGRILAVALVLSVPLIGWVLPSAEQAGQAGLLNSALHRVVIWQFTANRIADHPWRGWGMDASRSLPGADDETVVALVNSHGGSELRHYPNLPLHPHNGALQIWLELGLPGALLLAVLLWWIGGRLLQTPPPRRGVCAAAVVAAFVIGGLSYGVWQSWWQSSLWLATVLCAAVIPPEEAPCAA